MPPVSEAQRKLMYAAANRKGGVGGVPQSVAKEFVSTDSRRKLPQKKSGSAPNNSSHRK